eukprot:765988-Hanusia_phi.AAC.3
MSAILKVRGYSLFPIVFNKIFDDFDNLLLSDSWPATSWIGWEGGEAKRCMSKRREAFKLIGLREAWTRSDPSLLRDGSEQRRCGLLRGGRISEFAAAASYSQAPGSFKLTGQFLSSPSDRVRAGVPGYGPRLNPAAESPPPGRPADTVTDTPRTVAPARIGRRAHGDGEPRPGPAGRQGHPGRVTGPGARRLRRARTGAIPGDLQYFIY